MEHGRPYLDVYVYEALCVSMLNQLNALFHQNFEYPMSLPHSLNIYSNIFLMHKFAVYLITDLSRLHNTYIIPFILKRMKIRYFNFII